MSVLSPSPPRGASAIPDEGPGASAISDKGERPDGRSFKVSWDPQCELDHPSWVQAGRKLGVLGRGGQWWVGDWLIYGTFRWGQKYAEAARITGYDAGSLRNMASMASQFPPPRRRVSLTWCHHATVAGLSETEQDRWLDLVSAQRMTVADLRAALRAERVPAREIEQATAIEQAATASIVQAPEATVARLICPHCGGEVPLPGGAARDTAGEAAHTWASERGAAAA